MKKMFTVGLTSIILLMFLFMGCSGAGDEGEVSETAAAPEMETYEWIVQSCFPLNMALSQRGIVMWAEKVEEMSGGRLEITLHGSGEIVPGTEVLDAVREGALDAAANTPAFQKGEFPASDLFYTLPGGVTEFHDLFVWMYGFGGKDLEQEMYGDEIVVFPLGFTPPEQIWTNKEINTLEDIKGLKIRAAGLSTDLWNALGAAPVLLPGGEVVPSLQRGVVDAAEFTFPSMDVPLGLPDVSTHVYGPPLHMGANMFQLIINPDKWAELPGDLKAIVENAAVAASSEGYALEWIETMKYFDQMQNEMDLVIKKLPKNIQDTSKELTYEILEERSKEDEFFKKVWESQRTFLEKFEPYDDFSSFD